MSLENSSTGPTIPKYSMKGLNINLKYGMKKYINLTIIVDVIPPHKKNNPLLKLTDLYGDVKYIINAYNIGIKNVTNKSTKLNPNTIYINIQKLFGVSIYM